MNESVEKYSRSAGLSPIFVTSAVKPWGAERSMATIIKGLSEDGVSSRVICSSLAVAEYLNQTTNAQVFYFKAPKNKFFRLLAFAGQTFKQRKGCTAVVVFSVNLYFLAMVLRFLPNWRPRLVADVHDSFHGEKTLRMVGAAMYAYHRVIYISKFVGTMLPQRPGLRLIVRPISAASYTDAKAQGSSITVGIAGRLDAEKRIELAIEAVAMCESHISLNIYGDAFSRQDGYLESLSELCEKLLPGRHRFMGTVPSAAIYKEIDILFVANSMEASGRTVGEAMAAGVPVVVPSKGGAPEFVEHMSSGIIYEANSAHSASGAMSLLAASDELRSKLRSRGAEKIRSERSTSHVAKLYIAALTD